MICSRSSPLSRRSASIEDPSPLCPFAACLEVDQIACCFEDTAGNFSVLIRLSADGRLELTTSSTAEGL